jgi:hypothetical protein
MFTFFLLLSGLASACLAAVHELLAAGGLFDHGRSALAGGSPG